MNTKLVLFLSCILFCARPLTAQGTSFTYQGRLADGGSPATGLFDLQFALFDSPAGGNALAGTNTLAPVPVTNGLFTVTLDFGSAAFDGAARWLELAVRTNGSLGPHAALAPRQPLTPTPYAIHAGNATLLSGLGTNAFAPATGSAEYVRKAGDTMTGTLNLPLNGLVTGVKQLVVAGGNVGVGNPNPTRTLHAGSATDAGASGHVRIAVDSPTENDPGFEWLTSGGLNWLLYRPPNSSDLRLYEPTVGDRVTFKANGNVGIGTTTPQTRLQVSGGNVLIDEGNFLLGVNAAGGFEQLIRSQGMGFNPAGHPGVQIGKPGNHIALFIDPSSVPGGAFDGGQNEIMLPNFTRFHQANSAGTDWIDTMAFTNGNVGIGTTSPQASLHVAGDARIEGTLSYGNTTRQMLNLFNSVYGIGVQANREYFRSGSGFSWFNGGTHSDADNDPGAGGTRLMDIDHSGNLTVNGGGSFGGNVGIGTANTRGETLEVLGGIMSQGPTAGSSRLVLKSTAAGGQQYEWYNDAIGAGSGVLALFNRTQGNEPIAFTPSGNVGIGTTSPGYRLDVASAVSGTPVENGVMRIVGTGSNPATGSGGGLLFAQQDSAGTYSSYASITGRRVNSANDNRVDLDFNTGSPLDSQPLATRMTIGTTGNVGIGTTSPADQLEVVSGNKKVGLNTAIGNLLTGGILSLSRAEEGSKAFYIGGAAGANNDMVIYGQGGGSEMRLVSAGGTSAGFGFYLNTDLPTGFGPTRPAPAVKIDGSGNVGIGTTSPQAMLDVNGDLRCRTDFIMRAEGAPPTQKSWRQFVDSATYYMATLDDNNANENIFFRVSRSGQAVSTVAFEQGNVGIGTTTPTAKLEVNGSLKVTGAGNSVTTPVLTVTGGADLAEPFHFSSKDIPKGSVVVIDDENAGQLKLSESAYDRRVAGIVSGAGGVQPGITLSQQGVLEGGQQVALSGRVYVQADATHGAIKPGDMLTTSATPGHAMKVTDHAQAQGAILGKAMSRLESGKGLVLVLVTLQ